LAKAALATHWQFFKGSVEMWLSLRSCLALLLSCAALAFPSAAVRQNRVEREWEKVVARQQFSKNFRDLQVTSQQLLQEHVSGQLKPPDLSKKAKAIHRSAKTLRTLMALGQLAEEPHAIDEELSNAYEFDQSIKRLAKMVYDFAHNPIHQNSKVFNTVEAAKTQKNLLTIISLAKVIETQARKYTRLPETEADKSISAKPA
jgi:hypothetical protein